jgi:DNA-binding GntR family transcriptional regulator
MALQPIDTFTVKDRAQAAIEEAILSGKLQPGERIVEAKLASELRVGTTPVREALFELESRGFVSRVANKGTFVTHLSLEDARQIFHIRTEMEGLAVQLLQERVTPGDLDLLRTHAEGMRKAAAQNDLAAFYRSDLDFHRALWRLSGNRFLVKGLEQLVMPLFAFFLMRNPLDSRADLIASADRHFSVIEALAGGADARLSMEESMQFFWQQEQQLLVSGRKGTPAI